MWGPTSPLLYLFPLLHICWCPPFLWVPACRDTVDGFSSASFHSSSVVWSWVVGLKLRAGPSHLPRLLLQMSFSTTPSSMPVLL